MKHRPQRGKPYVDADGVRSEHHERAWLLRSVPLIVAAATVGLAVLVLMRPFGRPVPVAGPAPTEDVASSRPRIPMATPIEAPAQVEEPSRKKERRVRIRPRPKAGPSEAPSENERNESLGDGKPSGIDARDYIAALRASGETGGVAAFSPPGTRPPRPGVIVPEDYVLPEGFARHHQTTDDGRRLAPILTVAPNYEILDDAGNPVELVDGRIVPPEFAPRDLPVRMLEIPSQHDRGHGVR